MAKDPAVLWYYQDFIVGTTFMTNEEVGIYTRILNYQADKGHLTKQQVLSICKASAIPKAVQEKLKIDIDGLYYQERMDLEKQKRRKFTESRRKNAASAKHMEDENENVNENKDNNKNNSNWRLLIFDWEELTAYMKKMFGHESHVTQIRQLERYVPIRIDNKKMFTLKKNVTKFNLELWDGKKI